MSDAVTGFIIGALFGCFIGIPISALLRTAAMEDGDV